MWKSMTDVEASSVPSVFKEGWLRLNKKVLSGADGVVSKRSRSLRINIREAHLIFLLEFTNHPVCAAKERDLFINGRSHPSLKTEGNGPVSQQTPFLVSKAFAPNFIRVN